MLMSAVRAQLLESPPIFRLADDALREDWKQGAAIKCDPAIIGRITIDEQTRQLLTDALAPISIGGVGTRWCVDTSIRGEFPRVEEARRHNNILVSPDVVAIIDECTDAFTDLVLSDVERLGIKPRSMLETFVRGKRAACTSAETRAHIDGSRRRGSNARELRYACTPLGPATLFWSGTLAPSQLRDMRKVADFDDLTQFACETGDVVRFHELLPHAEPDCMGTSRLFMTSTMEYTW